jgi:hypothetical protein
MHLQNGDPTKEIYLGQYFDKAYKANSDGTRSTTETRILSEYGEFFPTEAGRVILTTKPDIDTGAVGECTVYVIGLSIDANHDGDMDLSFTGLDHTTAARPFLFWVNNDRDEPATLTKPQRDEPSLPKAPQTQDWVHGNLRCERNLEDFARLWITGLPALPTGEGYTITLSMTASSGNPAINLYRSRDAGGSQSYLTDPGAATAQFAKEYLNGELFFDYAQKLKTIDSSQSYTLPVGVVSGEPLFTRFLFEGVGIGSGQLTLTIKKDANIIAQTSAFIDLRDIKEFYEEAVVTDVLQRWPDMVLQPRVSGFRVNRSPAVESSANQLVVFVHGWRVPMNEYYIFAETMFKRLYWQGYQGKFAALRWPTRSSDTDPFFGLDFATYNRSEHIAFKSATGAPAYFNDLRRRFPDCTISVGAHSMGNIVMIQTLKELAAAGNAPIDNYVLMQAAVPAHCYDTTVPSLPAFVDLEQTVPTPNTYNNYGAGISAALRGAGIMVNFFNPDDFALGTWEDSQKFYAPPNGDVEAVTMKPNTLLGYYTDGTSHILRQNRWNTSLDASFYGGVYVGPPRPVTATLEIMPFVSRPRTKTVGAQAGVQGEVTGELNLRDQLGFGTDPGDHSGQWNRNIQDPAIDPFYRQLKKHTFSINETESNNRNCRYALPRAGSHLDAPT